MKFLMVKTTVSASVDQVSQDLWQFEKLQSLWNPITQYQITYDDGFHQECRMWVDWQGERVPLRAIRWRKGEDIWFFNPEPPPMMSFHRGIWRIRRLDADLCQIIAYREYNISPFLQNDETDEKIREQRFHKAFKERLETLTKYLQRHYANLSSVEI